jgi:hypothetical protein
MARNLLRVLGVLERIEEVGETRNRNRSRVSFQATVCRVATREESPDGRLGADTFNL